jgi:hypothetical protein
MTNILSIVLIILFAVFNALVIKSYKGVWNKTYKDAWHKVQYCIVILVGILIFNFTKELAQFYLAFYILYEPILNKLRKHRMFYVSKTGSVSDRFRTWLFGTHVEIYEIILKAIAITALIIIIL